MTHLKSIIVVLLAFVLNLSVAYGISPEMLELVRYETTVNAAASRSNKMISIQHYEIPLKLLKFTLFADISEETRQSLLFMRDGVEYVRWIINPEDTVWHKEVEKFLKANNVPAEKKTFFQAYQTASRSYIVVNPENNAEFSVKVSTDRTGGMWKDKKQTYKDALDVKNIMEHINQAIKNGPPLQHGIIINEPAYFGISSIDQAMIIRSYDGLADSKKYYVPGFSVLHEKVGAQIAAKNGATDPAQFWNDNYNKPLARALAEFLALTGVYFDSPHSQNFLVELDSSMKPTGKIVMRDFGDSYIVRSYFYGIGKPEIAINWTQESVREKIISIGVGVLHGNEAPKWIDMSNSASHSSSYNRWGADFFKEFRKEFINQTGLDIVDRAYTRTGKYFTGTLDYSTEGGQKLIELTRNNQQRQYLIRGGYCASLFN